MNANETKITVTKTAAGWVASNLPGETFRTRQAARDASKIGPEAPEAQEAPAPEAAQTVSTVADPALIEAERKIAELTARLEAAQNANDTAIPVAHEVQIVIPTGHALPDGRRRRTVYEADADGLAIHRSAASQAGERVLYPPYAWGGEAHVAIANALSKAGFVAGDALEVDDLRVVPGGKPDQARWGSPASRATARHRMTNAGMLERVGAGKRGVGYILTDEFFAPDAWPALAAAALADRANAPVVPA